jgi:hypothetical protein
MMEAPINTDELLQNKQKPYVLRSEFHHGKRNTRIANEKNRLTRLLFYLVAFSVLSIGEVYVAYHQVEKDKIIVWAFCAGAACLYALIDLFPYAFVTFFEIRRLTREVNFLNSRRQ